MKVELTKFKVQKGKSKIVDEYLLFLNENMKETLVTLEQEKMYIETIFREVNQGEKYLYWYSVQGEGGQAVEESENWIDKKHLAYWEECIDKTFTPIDLEMQVSMIPNHIKKEHDLSGKPWNYAMYG